MLSGSLVRRPHESPAILIVAALLAVAACARAEAPVAVAVEDTVTVVAPRAERHLGGVTTVTVVDLDDAGGDLADVLETAAGLQVRRYGGLGAVALPSIRGSDASRVTVLIDGVPLTDARTGVLDLSTLPLDRFERVEIHRGGLPAHLGGPGGAGAVNLVTRDAGRGVSELTFSAGSFGEAGGRWLRHARDGGLESLLLLHARRTDNRYRYLDDNGTFANPDDDVERHRANAWFRETGAALVLRRPAADGPRVRLSAGAYRRDGGVSGPVGAGDILAAERTLERLDATLGVATAGDGLGLELSARRDRDRIDDPDGEVGWDPPGTATSLDVHLHARLHGAAAADLPGPLGRVTALAVADVHAQRHDFDRDGDADPRRDRTTHAAGADLGWEIPALRLALMPSLRWQRHQDDFPPLPPLPHLPVEELERPRVHRDLAPSFAAVWEAVPGRLFVEARRHRSERAPTWIELFGQTGLAAGNRELVPEELDEREAGIRLQTGAGLDVRWTAFRSDADRAIIWIPNSQSFSRAENIGRTCTTGQELELSADLDTGASWWCALTRQDARDRGDDPVYAGKTLPHQPAWSVAAGAAVPVGDWTVRGRVTAEAANWRFRYHGGEEALPARTVAGLAVEREWLRGPDAREYRLTLEALNLTDDRIHDVEGYPLPGRSFRAALRIR